MTERKGNGKYRAGLRRVRRYAGRYARYVAQQSVALPVKMLVFMLFVCSVLALVCVGLMALCLPICGTGWDIAFLLLGMIGAFLTLLTVSAGLHHAVDYVIMQPAGHFLNPLPPTYHEQLTDEQTLVRASSGDDSALLRPVAFPVHETEPRQLLRAINSNSAD